MAFIKKVGVLNVALGTGGKAPGFVTTHKKRKTVVISILFVTHKKNAFATLIAGLEKKTSLKITYTQSGLKALDMMKENVFDLVVADQEISDMTGLAFAKKLVKVNPMINCSVVSSLPAEDFHEVSEGFGILMQLPVSPDETAGEALFERLSEVLAITQNLS